MSTQGDMVSQIERDEDRTDLTQEINEAISTAIDFYQAKNFLFSESRERTWNTQMGKLWYTAQDVPDIANLIRISSMWLQVSSTVYWLQRVLPETFEHTSQAVTAFGQPYRYTYYGQQIGVYPVPNKTYEVRFMGDFITPPPGSPTDTGNDWFETAYEMIRCRAKYYLHAHVTGNNEKAAKFKNMDRDAMINLKTKAHRLQGSDQTFYTEF